MSAFVALFQRNRKRRADFAEIDKTVPKRKHVYQPQKVKATIAHGQRVVTYMHSEYGMEKAEATALVARAIKAGIFNDLGSGSNVDLCVITADGTEYLRNVECPNPRTYTELPPGADFVKGRTHVLKAVDLPLSKRGVTISDGAAPTAEATAMDIA